MNWLSKLCKGYVKIRMDVPEPERFFRLCVHKNIPLWNLSPKGQYFETELFAQDFQKLPDFRRKTGGKIQVVEKHGLPFFLHRSRKRKAFFLGLLLGMVFLLFCSRSIWDIRVYGNHQYSRETFLEVLKSAGISDGVLKKKIDCMALASQIRNIFPDIVWVSAKIQGTCLVIQVKENEDSYEEPVPKTKLRKGEDLVSAVEGVIYKIVTRQGTPQVKEGQPCHVGDVLVTGKIAILNQDGEVQRYEEVIPDADIVISTKIPYENEFPLSYKEKEYEKKQKKYPMIRILGKEIIFGKKPKSKTEKKEMEVHTQEKKIYLTPSFSLPLSFGMVSVYPYEWREKKYTNKEAEEQEQKQQLKFMKELVEKKIYICGKNIQTRIQKNQCISKGFISVRIVI